jgi:hypothetical protein
MPLPGRVNVRYRHGAVPERAALHGSPARPAIARYMRLAAL